MPRLSSRHRVFYDCFLAFGNSRHRTLSCTRATLKAGIRINLVLAVSLADCANGTSICAGTASYTSITNYISHITVTSYPLLDVLLPSDTLYFIISGNASKFFLHFCDKCVILAFFFAFTSGY